MNGTDGIKIRVYRSTIVRFEYGTKIIMTYNRYPRYAVLLAAYNGERWIVEQIKSITRQVGVNIDLFISVDRSNDKTESIVKALCCEYRNIRLLPYGTRYGSASRNFFRLISDVDLLSYDYVALSDQDDIWLENKLRRSADVFKQYGVSGYSSDVIAFWDHSSKTRVIKKSYRQKKWDYFFESAGPGCSYVLCRETALMIQEVIRSNRDLVQKIDLHDWLIYAIVRSNGMTWHIDNQPTLLYRQHSNNEFGANIGLSAWKKRFAQIRSGWYKNQILNLLQLCDGRASTIREAMDGGISGRIYLLLRVHILRRRLIDQFILFFVLLLGFFRKCDSK